MSVPRAIEASKLVIYVGEAERRGGSPLYEVLLHFLQKRGVAGAVAIRGVAGFSRGGPLHTAALLRLAEDLPLRIEAVDSRKKIDALLPDLLDLVDKGLVAVEPITIFKPPAPGQDVESAEKEPLMKLAGHSKILRIFIGDDDQWEGEPLYKAILNRARMFDIAGATVYRAIEGYGAHRRRHKSGIFSSDAPIEVLIVDEESKIRELIEALDSIVTEGCLVVMSDADVIKYARHKGKTTGDMPGQA